jgi:mannose-1-phosphate guanylyltransferase
VNRAAINPAANIAASTAAQHFGEEDTELKHHLWVLVLAAGEGKRVSRLTHDRWGQLAPKQFSSIDGNETLLNSTLKRAKRFAPPERIVPIVAAQHRRWWESELVGIPPGNVIVQPENRGTAAGILLPLLWITQHDGEATVVILPSDHYVGSEKTLTRALRNAVSAVSRSEAPVVLLGIKPDGPEDEYGWIVPCPGPESCPHRVASFREKPDASTSACLLRQGALLNSFIMVADNRCLLALYRKELPQLWRPFEQLMGHPNDNRWQEKNLVDLYQSIPSLDFSKDILEEATDTLWVCPVPPCGWTDIGTPERLTQHLTHHGRPQ